MVSYFLPSLADTHSVLFCYRSSYSFTYLSINLHSFSTTGRAQTTGVLNLTHVTARSTLSHGEQMGFLLLFGNWEYDSFALGGGSADGVIVVGVVEVEFVGDLRNVDIIHQL